MNKLFSKYEELELSAREQVFLGIALLAVGILLGVFISPKGDRNYGSNNGNNNYGEYIDGNSDDVVSDEEVVAE